MLDLPVILAWVVFLIAVWIAIGQLRREFWHDRRPRRLGTKELPFADEDIERRGNRIFVDKLVAKRLAAKGKSPTC